MMTENNRGTARWQIRQSVHPISVQALLECLVEIASALEEFGQIARHHPTSRDHPSLLMRENLLLRCPDCVHRRMICQPEV